MTELDFYEKKSEMFNIHTHCLIKFIFDEALSIINTNNFDLYYPLSS